MSEKLKIIAAQTDTLKTVKALAKQALEEEAALRDELAALRSDRDRLQREVEALREDKGMLDWLNSHRASVEVPVEEVIWCRVQSSDDYGAEGIAVPYDIRAAIRKARSFLAPGTQEEPKG